MNRKLYEDFREYFKSDRHILDMQRRLGKRALRISKLVRIILYEQIEELLNKGRSVGYIIRKLEASKSTVYRLRERLWKKKK